MKKDLSLSQLAAIKGAFIIAITTGFLGCSKDQPQLPPPASTSSCSQIPVQSKNWTPSITKGVFNCLSTQIVGSGAEVDSIDESHFIGITKLLNESFSSPKGRKDLIRIIKGAKSFFPIIQKIAAQPNARKVLQSSVPQSHVEWLNSNLRIVAPELSKRPKKTAQDLLKIIHLFPNKEAQLKTLTPIYDLLIAAHSHGPQAQRIIFDAQLILASLSKHPDVAQVMNKLSRRNKCLSRENIVTDSPIDTTVKFFKQDRHRPLNFLVSAEQGYAFWNRTCHSPTANTPDELKSILEWVFEEWNLLQAFLNSEAKLNLISYATQIIQLDQGSQPGLLNVFFNSQVSQEAIQRLAIDSELRDNWLKGLNKWILQLESEDEDPSEIISLLNSVLEELVVSPSIIPGLLEVIHKLDPVVLKEVLTFIQEISANSWPQLQEAIVSGKALKSLDFFQWILQGKLPPVEDEAPVYNDHTWATKIESPYPKNAEAQNAKQLVIECHKNTENLELIQKCFQQHGLLFSPDWIRALWTLDADSSLLHRAHPEDLEYVSTPAIASSFWTPVFNWVARYELPPIDLLKVFTPLTKIVHNYPNKNWDSFLSSNFEVFLKTSTRELSSTQKSLRHYRIERSYDIDEELLSDPKTRRFLINPQFWQNLISKFLGDARWASPKKSLQKIATKRFQTSFWVKERVKKRITISTVTALDLLFWELKIPIISSSSAIASVLNSFTKLNTPDELRSWLDSKYFQLRIARKLSSIKDDEGEGIRRRIENAMFLIQSFQNFSDKELSDLVLASRFLKFFEDPRQGKINSTSAQALMAMHQLGLIQALNTAFDSNAAWAKQITKYQPIPNSVKPLFKTVSDELRLIIENLPPKELSKLAQNQTVNNFWIVRSIAASACSVFFNSPEVVEVFGAQSKLTTKSIKQGGLAFRSFLKNNKNQLQPALYGIKNILNNYPSTLPNKNFLFLLDALGTEDKLGDLWNEVDQLDSHKVDHLLRWLESGTPQRLMQWNRLMKVEK